MSIKHRVIRRLTATLANWSQKGGPVTSGLYYRFLSPGFRGEQDAVGAGISKYLEEMQTIPNVYFLRRNIHRIEKGLTMQPRRDKFASDYITETVERFVRATKNGSYREWTKTDEFKWMAAVLANYFDHTRSSGGGVLQQLEGAFKSSLDSIEHNRSGNYGPHLPTPSIDLVAVDDLLALARNRRSVRWFDGERVPREAVEKAIKIGMEGPTACNRQPYRFEIFDDPASVAEVAEIPMGASGYGHQIPGLIVVIGDLSAFFDERDRHLIYIDSCLASMGLILGLEAQGVSSCVINWPDMIDRDRAMRQLLGLHSHERVIMLIAYGFSDPQGLTPYSAKRAITDVYQFRKI